MRIEVSPQNVDSAAVLNLLHLAYAFMDDRIDPPSSLQQMTVQDVIAKAATEVLITASVDDDLVGCVFCRPEGGWLYVGKMAVAPGSQGLGIGASLMQQARSLAGTRGLRGLELETRIELTENHVAFAKMGFVKVADQSHEGYDRTTSIRMRCALAEGP